MLLFGVIGCSGPKYLPVETRTEIVYKDTTYYQLDTIVLPVERIVEVVPELDTLYMETSVASSTSWIDTSIMALMGKIENKPQIEVPVPVRMITRDSIVVKEVPVPVEVVKTVTPKWAWYCLGLCLLFVGVFILLGWLKFR
jgi:hypothetical protein